MSQLRRTLAPGCGLHGASQMVESASGLFGDSATDVLTGSVVGRDELKTKQKYVGRLACASVLVCGYTFLDV